MLVPRSIASIAKLCAKENTRYAFNGIHFRRVNGKPQAEATDGRRCIRVTWEEANSKDFPKVFPDDLTANGCADGGAVEDFKTILPMDAVKAAAKAVPNKVRNPIMENFVIHEPSANGTVKLAATDLSSVHRQEVASVEGQFPPTDDIYPSNPVVLGIEHPDRVTGRRARLHVPVPHSDPRDWRVEIHVNAKYLAEILDTLQKTTGGEFARLVVPLLPNRPVLIESKGGASGIKADAMLMPVNPDGL